MTSQFFLSITAFSCILSCSLSAHDSLSEEEESAQVANEERADAQVPQQQEAPKKMKPHFAGVRRVAAETSLVADAKKASKKVKNPWFSSKTHPKAEKKRGVETTLVELPSERPYFKKTQPPLSSLLAAQGEHSSIPLRAQTHSSSAEYPRTGFQAPSGHVFVTGEWLYWTVRQEGMEFATSRQITFDFQSGFRVGVGAHFPSSDGWAIYVNYTRFNPEHSHSAHGSFYPLFLFQGAGTKGAAVSEARGHWEIDFQNADVAFGKAYYLTQTLVFNPFFGLKGAWIEQHAKFFYEGGYIPQGQTFRTHLKNDFKGAGPLIGTEINWQLGAGFSLFGDVAAAVLVGQFDNKQQQYQLSETQVVHLDTHLRLISPMLQMVAGIAWDRNFNRDKSHFGISAGFETQHWWNQNQTEQFTDDALPAYVRQRGDLSFYGLTLRTRFDF